MKRTLTAVLTIFLTGASPTFAADAPGIGLMPSSGARSHDFRDHGRFHRRWTPGFVWVGYGRDPLWRSEEHTSELQSLMRISYAVLCLKKKKKNYKISISQYNIDCTIV